MARSKIGPRTWYAGTPEAESFKHPGTPAALLVTLDAAGPAAVQVPTGAFARTSLALDLQPGHDPAARLAASLPPVASRRDTLLRVVATGRTGLAGEAALARALAEVEHDFAFLEADRGGLAVEHAPADLEASRRRSGSAAHASGR